VKRRAAIALALAVVACATAPPPLPLTAAEAAPWVSAWDQRRAEAYTPRRLKALYRGEAAGKLGVKARGYLTIWWDGTTLVWKTSVPLSGDVREGTLRRDGAPSDEPSPFPPGLTGADVVGCLFGVLDLPADGRPAARVGSDVRLALDDAGREAFLSPDGAVRALRFPDGTRVTLEAASPLAARLTARGPKGSATLVLESWAAWPEGEPVPGTGG
jgi:hypothetical protein